MPIGRLGGGDFEPSDPSIGGPNERRTAKRALTRCEQTELPQSLQRLTAMSRDRRLAIRWVWEESRRFHGSSAELVTLDEKPREVLAIVDVLRQPGREHGLRAE
jgi:hypothetical protein